MHECHDKTAIDYMIINLSALSLEYIEYSYENNIFIHKYVRIIHEECHEVCN